MGSNKKLWMRIIILGLAILMIGGAIAMPFIR